MLKTIRCLLYTIVIGVILIGVYINIEYKEKIINNEMEIKENQQKIIELNRQNMTYISELNTQKEENRKISNEANELRKLIASRGDIEERLKVKVTAYDLSPRSCSKKRSHPEYGITFAGYNLKGKNYKTARMIAVDPKIIPLGSKVIIKFIDDKYKIYDGEYIAGDTGNLVKGNHVDLFLEDTGEKTSKKALQFGVTYAHVQIIRNNNINKCY